MLCAGLLIALGAGGCARLPPFASDVGRQQVDGAWVRPPYVTLAGYFGHTMPGATPDEVQGRSKLHYVHLWLPGATDELGVRLISPVGRWARPRPAGDVVDPAYLANRDSEVHFDPSLRLERCVGAVDPADIGRPCAGWVTLGDNDDSDELPAQPSGAATNALLRVGRMGDDPAKVLVRGLYRVGITTAKPGDVQGTWLLQVGTSADLPALTLARDTGALAKHISAAAGPDAHEAPPH